MCYMCMQKKIKISIQANTIIASFFEYHVDFIISMCSLVCLWECPTLINIVANLVNLRERR